MSESVSSQQDTANQSKKRRFTRVSRACVECRVRKIRCDARQPCEACEDFNRRCVYSSTKAQRGGGAPRTKILEERLRRARALIAQLQAEHPSVTHRAEIDAIFDTPPGSPDSASASFQIEDVPQDDRQGELENMMDGEGCFTAVDESSPIYYGGPSGFRFLEKTQQLFRENSDEGSPGISTNAHHSALSRLFDAPLPDRQALASGVSISQLLPSRATATRLLGVVFEQTYQLLRFIDVPWFHAQTDRIYEMDSPEFSDADHDFLPLLLGVLAIGYLFDPQRHKKHGCRQTIDQAMRHFIAARQMIDVTKCHDTVALQTIMVFALFLMSTARLATAHTYVALAAAAAMRLGLHSQTTYSNFTERENSSRRRLFWTIVKLDIYTGTILGLPGLVNLSHVDQVHPSGFMRDYQHTPGAVPTTRDEQRMLAASAQYRDLLLIISGMVQKLYPKTEKEAKQVRKSKRMLINSAVITETEQHFKQWRDTLPAALQVAEDPQSPALRSTLYELEMAHNLGLILLYRPFLHYLARMHGNNSPDHRQLRCASACVKISRETITRSDDMLRQGFLAPAAWQSVYTVFLAIVALIFYLATQKGEAEYDSVAEEAEAGIRVLASTSCQDIGSRRCLDVLKVLAKRLSHIVDLDIENIEKETPSFCQSSTHAEHGDFTVGAAPRTRPDYFTESPHTDYQPEPVDYSSVMQPQTQRSTLYSNPDSGHPVSRVHSHPQQTTEAPDYRQFGQSEEVYGQRSRSAYDFGPSSSVPIGTNSLSLNDAVMNYQYSMDDYLTQQQDMEVPFSDTFAWPFDPNSSHMPSEYPQSTDYQGRMHMGPAVPTSLTMSHPSAAHDGFNISSMGTDRPRAGSAPHHQYSSQHPGSAIGGNMPHVHPHLAHAAGTTSAPHLSTGGAGTPSAANVAANRGPRPRMPETTLTSEDIAAFMMRINPGEEPFL